MDGNTVKLSASRQPREGSQARCTALLLKTMTVLFDVLGGALMGSGSENG